MYLQIEEHEKIMEWNKYIKIEYIIYKGRA